jgi:hypothetical protein
MGFIDYISRGNPSGPAEDAFPQVGGSYAAPLLLYWQPLDLLYLNIGAIPLWRPLLQLSTDSVYQQLTEPLLGTVIGKLQENADPQQEKMARLLLRS